MLLILLIIGVGLIFFIRAAIEDRDTNKKLKAAAAKKKYHDDCDSYKKDLESKLFNKYYNSITTLEIADFILTGKSKSPFKVEIDYSGVTAFFSDGSSVGYCYRAHGLQPPLGTELVYPSYSPSKCISPYEYSIFLHSTEISYQNEFGEALRLRITVSAIIRKAARYISTGKSTSKGDAAMNKTATCPHCGYIGHLVCVSGDIGTYSCDRCHKMFKAFI